MTTLLSSTLKKGHSQSEMLLLIEAKEDLLGWARPLGWVVQKCAWLGDGDSLFIYILLMLATFKPFFDTSLQHFFPCHCFYFSFVYNHFPLFTSRNHVLHIWFVLFVTLTTSYCLLTFQCWFVQLYCTGNLVLVSIVLLPNLFTFHVIVIKVFFIKAIPAFQIITYNCMHWLLIQFGEWFSSVN